MSNNGLRNTSPNGWVIQKFGGTSIGKFPDKIADDIIRYISFLICLNVVRKKTPR